MPLITLIILSAGHFLIDLGSGLSHYSYGYFFVLSQDIAIAQSALYNFLAFGAQPVWGLILDRLSFYRWGAVTGTALIVLALQLSHLPELANALAATGNALFHLGCGAWVMKLYPGQAWPLGIFVGPGAVGIALSSILAKSYSLYASPVLAMLVFLGLLLACLPFTPPKIPYRWPRITKQSFLIILLLMVSTLIRSYGGLNFDFPWKANATLATILMFTVALGKMLGGFGADRQRLLSVVIALGLAAPLLGFLPYIPALGLLGVLLFQSIMAITLLALYEQLPEHPGMAFGLLCLGLWLGVLLKSWLPLPVSGSQALLAVLILMSMFALWQALHQGGDQRIFLHEKDCEQSQR